MTTNEAVDYIQNIVDGSIGFLERYCQDDKAAKNHVTKAGLAMEIIKGDLNIEAHKR